MKRDKSSPVVSDRRANKAVHMTPAQCMRQDMQVRWLIEAIAAQNRSPDEQTLDRASLLVPTKPRKEAP